MSLFSGSLWAWPTTVLLLGPKIPPPNKWEEENPALFEQHCSTVNGPKQILMPECRENRLIATSVVSWKWQVNWPQSDCTRHTVTYYKN